MLMDFLHIVVHTTYQVFHFSFQSIVQGNLDQIQTNHLIGIGNHVNLLPLFQCKSLQRLNNLLQVRQDIQIKSMGFIIPPKFLVHIFTAYTPTSSIFHEAILTRERREGYQLRHRMLSQFYFTFQPPMSLSCVKNCTKDNCFPLRAPRSRKVSE